MANRITIRQGSAGAWTITVRDAAGAVVTTYAGTEPLTLRVWPGDTRATSLTVTPTWLSAAAGTVSAAVTAAQSAALAPGVYLAELLLTDAGSVFVAWSGELEVMPAPASTTAGATYCDLDDLYAYGRHALLNHPQGYGKDQAAFEGPRARARTWFDGLLHAADRSRRRGYAGRIGDYGLGYGPGWGGGRDPWLTAQLAADALLATDEIREANARYALSLILAEEPEIAARHRAMATDLAKTVVAELDTDDDGVGNYTIDLTRVPR